MTKSIMKSILTLIANDESAEATEVREALTAELSKGEAKAQANRDLYESAKDVVLGALSETPVTIGELYDEIASRLPDGMTKGKMQYAITRLWADKVTKVEGKVNAYALKA